MFYKTCPNCGANLDPNEVCDCTKKEAVPQQRKQPTNKISNLSLSVPKRIVNAGRRCMNG